ncbi:MAG: methyl-accepting chemotaxis protein [Alphaproteobacteria bacterium]
MHMSANISVETSSLHAPFIRAEMAILLCFLVIFNGFLFDAPLWLIKSAALSGIILTGGIIWWLQRRVATPLHAVAQAMQAMAEHRHDCKLPEPGYCRAINGMIYNLSAFSKTIREHHLATQILEQAPLQLIRIDPSDNFRITYANKAARDAYQERHDKFPGLDADILKAGLALFGNDAAQYAQLLGENNNLPWKTKTRFGDEAITLNFEALRAPNGGYGGCLASWTFDTYMVKLIDDYRSQVQPVSTTIHDAAKRLNDAANAVNISANSSKTIGADVAATTETALNNIKHVVDLVAQMTLDTDSIAENVHRAATATAAADTRADESRTAITALSDAADKISTVVTLINKIAGQTNLLALNATIEAARAGEAGKGFAVVASEVKSLATQTAKATEEISEQVAAVQQRTQSAVMAIGKITESVSEVRAITADIVQKIGAQSQTTATINNGIGTARGSIEDIGQKIATAHSATQRTDMVARDVLKSSGTVVDQSLELQSQVDMFMVALRAY